MNVCHICGVPWDAGYFDAAEIKAAPHAAGEEQELVRVELHPQYCGVLLNFAQYAATGAPGPDLVATPGYEWIVLCNNQPRAPYLPTTIIRNPWGRNAFPIHLRLEEGCTLRFVVRRTSQAAQTVLTQVGGRLQGRYWYNTIYGGAPNRL